jgi:hypothetical protein
VGFVSNDTPDRPLSKSIYAALDAALELSDFNLRFITDGPQEADFGDFAVIVGQLLKVIQEQLVVVAAHVDDLEAEVRRLNGQQ